MKKDILIKICVALGTIFLFTSIIPALLSAKSDLSVFLGTVIIIGALAGIYLYGQNVLEWFCGTKQPNKGEER